MKKTLLTLLVCAGFVFAGNAQPWSENFNAGIPGTWTTIKADAGIPSSSFNAAIISGLTNKGWMAWQVATGDSAAITTSWFTSLVTTDRWLISPSFTVTDPNMVLFWEDYSPDPNFIDSLQVLLSPTAGTTQASFTTTLYNNKAATEGLTKKGVSLGAYNGQTVRVAFRDNSYDKFLLYIDDAGAAILPAKDGAILSVIVPKFAANNTPVKVVVQNAGAQAINSLTINYSVDGGTPVSETFPGLNIPAFGSQTLTFSTQLSGLSQAPHSLTVTLTQTDGVPDPVSTNNTASTTFTVPGASVPRNGLIEEFTSSTCAPCASFNATFDPLILANNANTAAAKFNLIRYQMNWPSPNNDVCYNVHGAARRSYYDVSGIPDHYTNGKAGGAGNQAEIDASKTPLSYLSISGTYTVKGDSLIASVTLTPNFTLTSANFTLHVAATEKHYTNNGATTSQKEYYHVMRMMFPDGNGTVINNFTSGTPQTFTFKSKFTVGSVTQNSFNFWAHPFGGNLIAFVQDNASDEVLQSVSIPTQWSAGVQEVSGIDNVSVYPNPAQNFAVVTLNLKETASVTIQLTDVLGKVVYSDEKSMNAGQNEVRINTDHLATGAYNIKITTEKGSVTQRLSVVK